MVYNFWVFFLSCRFVEKEKYNELVGGSSNFFLFWLKDSIGFYLRNGVRKGEIVS